MPPAVAPPPPPILDDDEPDEPRYRRGSAHGRSRLDEHQVAELRRLRAEGWTERALAARYGVAPATVHYVLTRTWRHVPENAPDGPQDGPAGR